MTVKEIAKAVGKDGRTVRRWVNKAMKKYEDIAFKYSNGSPANPSSFTEDEAIKIIECGIGVEQSSIFKTSVIRPIQYNINAEKIKAVRAAYNTQLISKSEARSIIGVENPFFVTWDDSNTEEMIEEINNSIEFGFISRSEGRRMIGVEKNPEAFTGHQQYVSDKSKGWVYLIYDSLSNNYKIGMTSGDLSIRFSSMRTSNPNIELTAATMLNEYKNLEKDLHKLFEDKNISGEWFDLDEEDLSKLASDYGFTFFVEDKRNNPELFK